MANETARITPNVFNKPWSNSDNLFLIQQRAMFNGKYNSKKLHIIAILKMRNLFFFNLNLQCDSSVNNECINLISKTKCKTAIHIIFPVNGTNNSYKELSDRFENMRMMLPHKNVSRMNIADLSRYRLFLIYNVRNIGKLMADWTTLIQKSTMSRVSQIPIIIILN